MALKLYLRNSVTPYTPAAIQGDWDHTSENAVLAMLDAVGGTKTTHDSLFSGTLTNHDRLSRTFVYQLPQDFYVEDGALRAVVGLFEKDYPAPNITLYPHWHLYTLRVSGEVETVIETLVDDDVGYSELDNLFTALAVAASAVMLRKDDYLVLELGWRGTTLDPVYGGTRRALNSYSGALAAQDDWDMSYDACPWIQLPGTLVSAPSAPIAVDNPAGGESWREGSVQTIEWTPADPEQAEGFTCLYDIEFSAAGDFTDAVTVVEGEADASYVWTLPESLVGSAGSDTCKIRVRSRVEDTLTSSAWVESSAFTVLNSTAPTVTLIDPEDAELFSGGLDLMPTLVFGTADIENDPVHVRLLISEYADYHDPTIDTDSGTDYADWEEAASPFSTWSTMPSGGATAGNRIRYKCQTALRYDQYYAKVQLYDAYSEAVYDEFTFIISVDPDLALSVTIDGQSYPVHAVRVWENTGGEPSPIELAVARLIFQAHPVAKGTPIAIASGLGNHNRTWNGTVESRRFVGSMVTIKGLQDDAYLSRKIVTTDYESDDIGANLAAMVSDHGDPLTGTNIDTSTGVDAAIESKFKQVREIFRNAMKLLPGHQLWVDSGGDINFKGEAALTGPNYFALLADPETGIAPTREGQTGLRMLADAAVELSTMEIANKVYVVVRNSSPVVSASATNDSVDPKHEDSPREIVIFIDSGDADACAAVAASQLALRQVERQRLTDIPLRLRDGLAVLRGTKLGVVLPGPGVDVDLPVQQICHDFGAKKTSIAVGEFATPRNDPDLILELAAAYSQLQKDTSL